MRGKTQPSNKNVLQQCITAIYSRMFIFYGVRQSLCSSRRIRLPFNFAQGWLTNPLGIAKVSAKPKINAYKPVTDGYTRPL